MIMEKKMYSHVDHDAGTPLQKDTHSVRDTMQSTIAQRASSAFARISTRASMRRQVRVSSSSFNHRVLLLPAHGLVVCLLMVSSLFL